MFSEPTTPALRMIERAAKVYKHCYGDYPETVGLDIFSRWREWQESPFVERYYWRDMQLAPVIAGDWKDAQIICTNVSVKVVPAVFGNTAHGAYGLRCTDPSRGRDEVWCKRGEHEVLMHLLFTDRGYHAEVWEEREYKKRA